LRSVEPTTKRLGAVVLAAGLGSRFALGNKLLHPYHGKPLLAWALATIAAVPVQDRLVVIGPDETTRTLIDAHQMRVVVNPSPAAGMGCSLALGIAALLPDLDGVFVCLGDMPALRPAVFEVLAQAFAPLGAEAIVVPRYAGQRGHPVLFGQAHFAALANLRGDQGARDIIARSSVFACDLDEPGVLRDVDTVADLS
jgi:molybdenum cofactor cytidylyltransferase